MAPKPQLVALLLCDRAFQEAGSLKWHIAGAFNAIQTPALPFTYPRFSVFVALSDFAGRATVEVHVRDEAGQVVRAVRGKIPELPPGLFQHEFRFENVEFREAGSHTLELFADGELIALRSLRVQSLPSQDQEEASAVELGMEHREQLLRDAREVWDKHPHAKPIGLIAAAAAAEVPWYRKSFESLFGSAPPGMDFVGVLDRNTVTRLLADHGAQLEGWLAAFPETPPALPIVVVQKGSVQFAQLTLDDD